MDYDSLRGIHHWYNNDADVRLKELAIELILKTYYLPIRVFRN